MNFKTLLDQISALVTPELAVRLSKSQEPTLFFEAEVLEVLDINVSLRRSPDTYGHLQNHFEDLCDDILAR